MTERERERDRLYYLFQESKCPAHFWDNKQILDTTNYLLANGVIVPPCKVDDYLWFFKNGEIVFGRVIEITTSKSGVFAYLFELDDFDEIVDEFSIPLCEIGKTLFFTKEEAEQALKARDEG